MEIIYEFVLGLYYIKRAQQVFLFLMVSCAAYCQLPFKKDEHQKQWVDSVYNSLTLEQKIGQLFMVAAYSNKNENHKLSIIKLIEEQYIGGLIFFQGNPKEQVRLTNLYQSKARTPLFIAMDAEWGLNMRISNTKEYPWAMTLGAISDNDLIYRMGRDIARQCKRLGVHINFAPVVDVNTNPKNPIIGNRSFGDNPYNVASKGIAYTKGMQDNYVMACAKHFPGHGDTYSDSHKTLPIIEHKRSRIDSIEMYPFKKLIKAGISSIMVAHLGVPSIEHDKKKPSSLSSKVVSEILKKELGFEGLIFTDALNMKGVSNLYKPGRLDIRAFKAGNDMLVFSENVTKAVSLIKKAIQKGRISEKRLKNSVYKILLAKYWAGLNKKQRVEENKLLEDLNDPKYNLLQRELIASSISVLRNREFILPIKELAKKSFAYVALGKGKHDRFLKSLNRYIYVNPFSFNHRNEIDILNELSSYDLVIIGIHGRAKKPWDKDILSDKEKKLIQKLSNHNKVILTYFTSPYSLGNSREIENAEAVVLAYQNTELAQDITAQILFGALAAKGILPIYINSEFNSQNPIQYEKINRLSYSIPESCGLNSQILENKLDSIVELGLNHKAFPGAQLWVSKNARVVIDKSYGYQTYNKRDKVENHHLFDLASLTKILVSAPLIMELVDRKKIDLDKPFSRYYLGLLNSNKRGLKLRDILAHQARLKPWIPFYKETLGENGGYLEPYYSKEKKEQYSTKVARDLFILDSYKDSIYHKIKESNLRPKKRYVYSDLGYYLIKDYLEKLYKLPFEEIIQKHIFDFIGVPRMSYLPLKKFNSKEIAPTENDMYFRKQLLRGYVNDQGAAMMGGVGGHAGLFANANDVGKIMQMYLQNGNYGDIQFFKPQTIKEFTSYQFPDNHENRRGLCFDKHPLVGRSTVCNCVSSSSFGHTGFTGTIAWADPGYNLVFVFLSNRVYPEASNRRLITMDIRAKLMQELYNEIWRVEKQNIDTDYKLRK